MKVFVNHEPAGSGSGSGSVISEDADGNVYILTNRHVVDDHGKKGDRVRFEIEQYSGPKFNAVLDFYSREHDLAILTVKEMAAYTEPLNFMLKKDLSVGQPVYAVGSPYGLRSTFTAGVISALRDTRLQTDATTASGSSGGPLLERHGAICAVATSSYRTKDLGFAIYADTVLEVLEERMEHIEKSP